MKLEEISEMVQEENRSYQLKVGTRLFVLTSKMVQKKRLSEIPQQYHPTYIERLFAMGTLVAYLYEMYYVDGVLRFPFMVAPYKVYIFAWNEFKASNNIAKGAARDLYSLLQKDIPIRLDVTCIKKPQLL